MSGDASTPAPAAPDFKVEFHGSLFLVRPVSEACRSWLQEHTDGQWFGGALVVEPRYVDHLVNGLIEHEFTAE